ncbi:sensor histidine kinase [Saccharibacillus alkalitolerans]|uniref:histidine kinase n=1 Tax=Saccharibacillus alkalitolerans TaxID=2705290 RepID=A0ABX0F8R6_9BACL|nr:sensor histidine kinase [Saccharibacillus alkalitolerans]NGZ76708.1 HAMP domain-containing histidine kinase [Saccharibacillus alkalitolerans]
MKLFWRDQLPLILFFFLQALLIPLLYWLSGEARPPSVVLYGMLLSAAVLAGYLAYRYVSLRRMYRRLEHPSVPRSERLEALGDAPLAEAVSGLIRLYDREYEEELAVHRSAMDRHITFIGRWVHQMKTPLSVLQLSARDIEDEDLADSIAEELDRLRQGLEMVIYTSRLERFEQDFSVERLPLALPVREALAEQRRLFIKRRISPVIEIAEDAEVYTDAKWLRFILGQILTNAVHYTEGPGKRVFIRAYRRGPYWALDIRDEGIGIAREDRNRVFNPYFTGQRGRQYKESTGMGLYLVSEICRHLDHDVELESEPGVGTTIRLVFREVPRNAGTEHNLNSNVRRR